MVALALELDPARQAVKATVSTIAAAIDTITLERAAPSGNVAAVRGADDTPKTGDMMLFRDYEAPFDLELVYTVRTYDAGVPGATATATIVLTWQECDAFLVDLARPTNSFPVTIEHLNELAFDAPTGVHRVLDRRDPVLTSLPAWTPAAELAVLTESLPERDQARVVFGAGYPFLLRTSPLYGIGNLYFGLTGFTEERITADGTLPARRFRVACVQVARPDAASFVPLPPNTYANVTATYPSYTAMQAAVGTYDTLAYTYPEDPGGGDLAGWLPDDI